MDRHFDLDLLQLLVAVVDGGSLAAAARTLGASRATVRRRLADLEARAAVPLVARHGDRLVPTPAGALLVRGARSVVAEANALLAQASQVGNTLHGLVRVALTAGEPPFLAGLALRAVRQRWPEVQFEVISAPQPHRLLTEHADMALSFQLEPPKGPWEAIALTDADLRLVASPDYLARRGVPERLTDLAQHELLAYRAPTGGPLPLLLTAGGQAAFPTTPALTSNSVHGLRQLTTMGLGIGWFPDGRLTPPGEPKDALQPVLTDVVGGVCPYWLLLPDAFRQIPRLRAVADALLKVIEDLRL